jgi:hypothetical protein
MNSILIHNDGSSIFKLIFCISASILNNQSENSLYCPDLCLKLCRNKDALVISGKFIYHFINTEPVSHNHIFKKKTNNFSIDCHWIIALCEITVLLTSTDRVKLSMLFLYVGRVLFVPRLRFLWRKKVMKPLLQVVQSLNIMHLTIKFVKNFKYLEASLFL